MKTGNMTECPGRCIVRLLC